jgi:hypothetical protein
MYRRKRFYRGLGLGGLIGVALLLASSPATAQFRTPTTSGGSFSGGAGGGFSGGGMSGGSFSGGSISGGGSFSGGSFSGGMNSTSGGNFALPSFGGTYLPGLPGSVPGVANSIGGSIGRGSFGANQAVSQYNPFVSYYANPLAIGYPGTTSGLGSAGAAFGQPIYVVTNTGLTGGVGSGLASIGTPAAGFGASSIGVRRAPAYTTSLGFAHQPPSASRLAGEAAQVLERSTRLTPTRDIKVVAEGQIIVLQGWVADDHDRRLAEALVRLTPGVHEVRNELKIQEVAPPPTRIP